MTSRGSFLVKQKDGIKWNKIEYKEYNIIERTVLEYVPYNNGKVLCHVLIAYICMYMLDHNVKI